MLAKRHSDNIGARFTFQAKDDFTDPNWAELSSQQEGTVIGPYLLSEGVYRISRNLETSFRPDSVEARHILIRPSSVVSIDSAQRFVDKLKQSIEKELNQNQQDVLFAELAKKYSEDSQSAIKGGDLGWFKEGLMVDEFNEICFTSKTRDLKSVTSQFGVHLVQVIKKSKKVKKSKIIYIDRYVDPSTQTFNTYYSEAAQFAGKILNENITFDSLVQLKNLVKRTDVNVSRDKQAISGLPESREMIRWMNKSNVGDVSEVFQFGDSYVVAFLKKSRDDEYLPIEEIEEEIIAKITNEKKGEIIAKFTANKELEDIALEYNILVNKQKTIAFDNSNIPGVGFEPKLVGSLFALPLNITSKPILGNNSAFVVQVTAKNSDSKNENIAQEKNRIRTEILRYSSLSYNSLKNNAEIEDFRSDFY